MQTGYTLITGATSGIGLALVETLATSQTRMLLVARNLNKLQALQSKYPQCEIFSIDLSEQGSAERVFAFTEQRGIFIERLINNAGMGLFGDFSETDLTTELTMIQLNIASLIALTKLFLPAMQAQQRGEIINVSSIASFMPGPKMSVYYATKAFVTSFSQALAYELKDHPINVRILAPGPVATNFEKASRLEDSKLFQRIKTQTPQTVAKILLNSNKSLVIPGIFNKATVFFARYMPSRLVTAIVARIQSNK